MPATSVGGCCCDDVTASLCRGATCEVVTACDAPGRPLARGGDGGITLSSDDDAEEHAGGGWRVTGVLGRDRTSSMVSRLSSCAASCLVAVGPVGCLPVEVDDEPVEE